MGEIARYAGLIFEVSDNKILSFQDMHLSKGINYEEHPRAKKHPLMEFTSRQNAEMTLKIVLKASLGVNPRKIWKKMADLRDDHKAAFFYLGPQKARKVSTYRWVITNIEYDFEAIGPAGQPIDMGLTVSFKQYPYKEAKVEKPSNKKSGGKKTSTKAKVTNYAIYTVKKGDCLWNLAKKYYGKGSKYMKIFNANRDGKDGTHKLTNPNILMVGWKIKIPK